MKNLQILLYALIVGLALSSCGTSLDDLDDLNDVIGETYFKWDSETTSYTAAVTTLFSGGAFTASAQSHQMSDLTIRIVAQFAETGTYILNKNNSDPDDHFLMEYTFNNKLYITTENHFITLKIESVNEQKKEIEGTFSGTLVNNDDITDLIIIENGEFLVQYF